MSLKVDFLSDSMLKRIDTTFNHLHYTRYHAVYSVPGSEIDKMKHLFESHSTDTDLIIVNCGINNLLNGYSVNNCIHEYDRTYKAITTCSSAHVAFNSVSYIADNKFTNVDESAILNSLIHELNNELQRYCDQNEKAHFIDLSTTLRGHEQYIERRHLARDGLHYSTTGLLKVARLLMATVEQLKRAIRLSRHTTLLSQSINTQTESWPELPKPAVQATFKPVSHRREQCVKMSVSTDTPADTSKVEQIVKTATVSSRTFKRTKQEPSKEHVYVKPNSSMCCNKSKSSKHNKSQKIRTKQFHVDNVLLLRNRFSVLQCHDVTDNDDADDGDDLDSAKKELHRKRKVRNTRTLTNNRNSSCANISCENTAKVRITRNNNRMNTENPIFTNPYRVSTFHTLMWTKSCFIQRAQNQDMYFDNNVRRITLLFDIVPRFLQTLNLSISDPLVYTLLLKYGINVSRTNRPLVTETTTTFTDTDSLINCMLKMLLRKTRPSNETSMRIIHKTGIHLLKFNTLYGTHFTSCIDTTILSNILINKFDCDLLLLCGDIESNPSPRQSTNQGATAERTSTMITDCYEPMTFRIR